MNEKLIQALDAYAQIGAARRRDTGAAVLVILATVTAQEEGPSIHHGLQVAIQLKDWSEVMMTVTNLLKTAHQFYGEPPEELQEFLVRIEDEGPVH